MELSTYVIYSQIILRSVSELNLNNDKGDTNSKIRNNCENELNKKYDMQD